MSLDRGSAVFAMGGGGGLVASSSLRRLGVVPHRRGLAIASVVVSLIPFAGTVPALVMEIMHLTKTRDVLWDPRDAAARGVSAGNGAPVR